MPASGMARLLGCTRNMVIGKLYRLGMLSKQGPRPSPIARKHRAAPSLAIIYKPKRPANAFTRGYRPRPEPKVATPAPDTPNVTLAARTGCAWATNDGKPFLFCNAATPEGRAYCQHHIERMYTVKGGELVKQDSVDSH